MSKCLQTQYYYILWPSFVPFQDVVLSCIGQGPIVRAQNTHLDFGRIPVLKDITKALHLLNQSPIPAHFSVCMVNKYCFSRKNVCLQSKLAPNRFAVFMPLSWEMSQNPLTQNSLSLSALPDSIKNKLPSLNIVRMTNIQQCRPIHSCENAVVRPRGSGERSVSPALSNNNQCRIV